MNKLDWIYKLSGNLLAIIGMVLLFYDKPEATICLQLSILTKLYFIGEKL